ncbi:hypothetical protein ACE1CI_04080 [Aerosakkonemataceae cyanobacterium BLCC-F50]|uniref:vWA-MoxR associated protein N-terminal HTH domain-containing protein n=1 Tax=Floridaenema flaviceps BLCC-F50 TaxID=3153642 RepID=A0ABV4XK75_9CYAN
MDIPQLLQFVDEAVYAKTNKHLNDLQRRIITGILNGQKYADVSETYGYSAQHVKKSSHELLQMLSEVLGEKVNKSNLESVLERQINVNITFGNKNTRNKNAVNIGSIKSCPVPSIPISEKSDCETTNFQQQTQNQTKIETIEKLRNFGLSDEQIAEALDIPLDVVNQIDLDE